MKSHSLFSEGLYFLIINELLAIIRFVFFIMPASFLDGLSWILFDKREVTDCEFIVRRFRDRQHKEKILKEYLEKCHKQMKNIKDK